MHARIESNEEVGLPRFCPRFSACAILCTTGCGRTGANQMPLQLLLLLLLLLDSGSCCCTNSCLLSQLGGSLSRGVHAR